MRHTRSHTKNRRSHHALKEKRLSTSEGGVKHPRHKALLDGTPYRGRVVAKKADTAPAEKKTEKKEVAAEKVEEAKEEKEK